jgi:hypothetical protein
MRRVGLQVAVLAALVLVYLLVLTRGRIVEGLVACAC